MKRIVVLFILTVLFTGINGYAQQFTPPIQNFSSTQFNAASQNWDVSIDDKGIVYAANNQGLLSYDGQRWEFFPLKSGSTIRSVHATQGRIYTGSYQEFGYWSRDDTGKMNYTSLTGLLGETDFKSEEIWEILSYKGGVYFRSFGTIYKYKDDYIEVIRNGVINKMFVYKDRLLLAVGRDGLFFLNPDGSLGPIPNQELLVGKEVLDMVVLKDKLLIGTRKNLYVFDGERVEQYGNESLNREIDRYELNRIMKLNEEEVIIGTIKNGIIHYNTSTGNYEIYNRNSGLQNNTVLSMAAFGGAVWLGLDNGIDRIDFNSSFSFFTDASGELGTVYDIAIFKDKLYLASNTGVYWLEGNGIRLVEGAEGHSWNLEILDQVLYANHNLGIYKIIENKFIPIDERTGSFEILPASGRDDYYLYGTYTGISSFSEETNTVNAIDGIEFPVKQLIYEDPRTLWAVHPYEGLYQIGLSEDLSSTTYIDKINRFNGKNHSRTEIFKINGQIAVFDQGEWYSYNRFLDTIEDFKELKAYSDHRLLLKDQSGIWFANEANNSLVYTDFNKGDIIVPSRQMDDRLVKNNENVIKKNDSVYYVTLKDGFAKINMNLLKRAQETNFPEPPILKGFIVSDKRFHLGQVPEIAYEDAGNISVLAAMPGSENAQLHYALIAEDRDTVYGKISGEALEFQNLQAGAYMLNLFALNPRNVSSAITAFEFIVEPPWYFSSLMKVIYFLSALVLLALFYWSHQLKMKKQHKVLEKKFETEHQVRLGRLEKERLLSEISLKRKELANTTLVAAKKNEVLLEIQSELNKDRNNFSNQFRIKHIMNKIDKAIKNNEEWKVFKTNFDEIHEDFFKSLLEAYPNLSSKDLKLCSYLKMNLSSKEIAPLMAISVRGVEVHRYRLRKKMGLSKKENLSKFLIKHF